MIIIRFAEIGLKGKNRIFFEKALMRNIQACLDKNNINYKNITRLMGRILVVADDPCDCLACVFGIASFSYAVNAGFNMEQVK
ncbi:tRNA 4-thiouridine(8) synthase ThiI, partial [Candidatus Woesearchaeota archaeon]|nr:tRNA 4-thiouridine(8) synthase ThiI [Candidatus Woesearchaeota archaeon]